MNVNFGNSFGRNFLNNTFRLLDDDEANEAKLDRKLAGQVTNLAIEMYRQLKESGLLKQMGQDLLAAGNALRANQVSNDVAAYRAYKDAGMPEDLIMILLARPRIDAKNVAEFVGKAAKGKAFRVGENGPDLK